MPSQLFDDAELFTESVVQAFPQPFTVDTGVPPVGGFLDMLKEFDPSGDPGIWVEGSLII